jgi:predicted permease
MMLAVLLGLALAFTNTPLPEPLVAPLTQVGQATPTLAFLTIGLGLDLRSLRGQTLALAGIATIKLVVMPALVAVILLALAVRGDVAHTAVLQAAMPTAVVSAIIASDAGCDARLASAAAVTTTLLSLATLPLLAAILHTIGL